MQIKRFKAQDMTDALRLIKLEFGSEAVILSAKNLKKGRGILGLLANPGVEVTAATDSYHPEAGGKIPSSIKTALHDYQQGRFGYYAPHARGSITSLKQQKTAIKNRPEHMTNRNSVSQSTAYELLMIRRQMVSHGVDEALTLELMEKTERIASIKPLTNNDEIKSCLVHILGEMGISCNHTETQHKKQKLIAFVGPTGVGKTTTVAKLATYHALQMAKRVALITLDNYRIGAIDQLEIYAKIIGIPIEVATSARELKMALKKFRNEDLILIDTAGISQGNESQFNELASLLDKLRHVEIQLLLSATTKDDDLNDILKRFRLIPVSGLIFTKLDESTTYGNILNQLSRSKFPVSYFTNGQQVPEDIEIASLDKLLDLILFRKHETKLVDYPHIILKDKKTKEDTPGQRFSKYYVANKTSDVFHYPDCKWGKKIKKDNIIEFENIEDAMNKGFKPCGLCNPDNIENHNLSSGIPDKKRIATFGY